MTIEEFAGSLQEFNDAPADEQIILTRLGKPLAVVKSINGLDEEDISYVTDPEFLKMIAARRREPTVPFEKVKAKLLADERRLKAKKTPKKVK